jgi:hypothetical protein
VSRISGNLYLRLCVQIRLACSAGVSPVRGRARAPVAWMAGKRGTKCLKPIDKASFREVSELSGRNESERIGGPESGSPGGRACNRRAKTAWIFEI